MKNLALCGLILSFTLCAAAAAPPAATKSEPITITTHVDKTAVWVGDELRYTVRVVHDQNVELVLDNFKKDHLPLAPFVLNGIDIEQGDWTGGKKLGRITLRLSAVETGKNELTIPSLQIFYFIREPGLTKKESPVTTAVVPPMKIGLRSVLVPERLTPREAKALSPPRLEWALAALAFGLAGILWLFVHAVRWGWKKLRRNEAVHQLTRKMRKGIVRQSLTQVRADVAAAGNDPRLWSAAIAGVLRDLIEQMLQAPAVGLTPEEIEKALAGAGMSVSLSTEAKSVLAQCDELRYGKNPNTAPELRTRLLQAAEGLICSPQFLST